MAEQQEILCDVLVIGSGAGGLAAAITAKKQGLDVLVIEKDPWLGGTTALSGGWLWIPCNPLAQRAGVADSLAKARLYLKHELGDRYDEARISAFLDAGPSMVDFFERETAVRFFLGTDYPDYHPDAPGALAGGRAVCAESFDGRELGDSLGHVKPPAREMTLFGIKVGSGPDFRHFANAQRSLRSAAYVAKRILIHFLHLAVYGRDVTLVSGNALVGRLLKTALDLGIRIQRSTAATGLNVTAGRVTGASALEAGKPLSIVAKRGVVSAAGGFPHDEARRQKLFRQATPGGEYHSLGSRGNTGDGLRMAEAVGAAIDESLASPASWMPVSRVPRRDGTRGIYPHSFDRGKPGVIAVTPAGLRFANEGNSYHDFGEAMIRMQPAREDRAAFLVCDSAAIRRYGLGMAKPFPIPLAPYLRSGYLKRGATLEDLAKQTGMDPDILANTVRQFNAGAREGRDTEFGRGGNVYNVYQGDRTIKPSPCVAPLEQPPYYAVEIYPGDLSTFVGLKTDEHARVLTAEGEPVPGLYAVGTDMASVFGGYYPGPGINLGPAMTFGYIAAQHLARQERPH